MDGFGLNDRHEANAVYEANTPNIDKLMEECPFVKGNASGLAVGLPDGQMGNSEVGHLNMGAGRVVYQELTRITKAIQDGDFFENPALMSAINQCKWFGSTLHIFGLLSDGGVHSHIDHMFALLELARRNGLRKVCFHCFMDGRDTDPHSGKGFIEALERHTAQSTGVVASIIGRYYAMDRDKRWERVKIAYDALVNGIGERSSDMVEAVQKSYDEGVTDEFIKPFVRIDENGQPVGMIRPNDVVIFFNYRPARAREITRTLVDPKFDGFTRQYFPVTFVCTTEYDATMPNVEVAYPRQAVRNGLGEYLSNLGLTQLRIAETEKYAHVTFFFNGGENAPFPGEDDVCVPSPKGIDFDQKPELSLPAVADQVMGALGKYDFVVTNFANGDVIGHTLNTAAKLEACKHVSHYLDVVVHDALAKGYVVAVTADHGNIEKLYTAAGKPDGAHTTNLVPFILMDPAHSGPIALRDGCLGDVAPTVLNVMGIPQPAEMTGKSLAEGHDFGKDRKMLLIICDGWGLGSGDDGDAIHLADTPYWDSLLAEQSWSKLHASGEHVGLGSGKAGNSEAGHSNLGAGRCVMQDDVRLDAAVKDGSFKKNPIFLQAIEHAKKNGTALHLLAYLTYKSSHGCID